MFENDDGVFWNTLVPELTVTDLEASLVFYAAAGFQIRYRRTSPAFAYIEQGQAQLMLEQEHPGNWKTGVLQRPYGRGINFQIEVDSVHAVVERLRHIGTPLFREPAEAWYASSPTSEEGQIECLAQDPDGYLLRFIEVLGTRGVQPPESTGR